MLRFEVVSAHHREINFNLDFYGDESKWVWAETRFEVQEGGLNKASSRLFFLNAAAGSIYCMTSLFSYLNA